jgi:hypothetical protein
MESGSTGGSRGDSSSAPRPRPQTVTKKCGVFPNRINAISPTWRMSWRFLKGCVTSPFRSSFSIESDHAFHDSDQSFGAKGRGSFDFAGSDRIRQGFHADLVSGAKRRRAVVSGG